MHMKVLVTGATGFIGSHLVDALLARGDEVRILVRRPSNIEKFKRKNIEIVFGDIRDVASLKKATEDIDVVYHLAALLGGPNITSEELREVNVQGTENVLKASVTNKVKRFLYLSAGAVMGNVTQMADETVECNPSTPYAQSKYDAEQLALKYMNDLSVTIVRSTMVYGPGEIHSKRKMIQMIEKGLFRIIGNGKNQVSWVYVDNLVQGIILASKKERAIGAIYIISDERPYTMNELVEAIAKELGMKTPGHVPTWIAVIAAVTLEGLSKIFKFSPPLFRDRVISLTANHSLDCSKACRDLGYKPNIALEEGIKRTVKYYNGRGYVVSE